MNAAEELYDFPKGDPMTALADVTDPRFTDDQRAVVARFESAPTPPEVREAAVIEQVARAIYAVNAKHYGDRLWGAINDGARDTFRRDATAAAAAYRAQDGGAEETVDEGGRVLIGDAWVAQASREALQAECTRLSGEAGFHLGRAQKAEEAVRRVELLAERLDSYAGGRHTAAADAIRAALAPQADVVRDLIPGEAL